MYNIKWFTLTLFLLILIANSIYAFTLIDKKSTSDNESNQAIETHLSNIPTLHRSTCTLNSECNLAHSQCLTGQCFCLSNYYYERQSNTCRYAFIPQSIHTTSNLIIPIVALVLVIFGIGAICYPRRQVQLTGHGNPVTTNVSEDVLVKMVQSSSNANQNVVPISSQQLAFNLTLEPDKSLGSSVPLQNIDMYPTLPKEIY